MTSMTEYVFTRDYLDNNRYVDSCLTDLLFVQDCS